MTQASWQRSNAFTRLVTIAAICNRAQFTEDSDADKPKLLGKEAPEEETQGVFTSQLKKRQEAEAARKAAMGGPSGGHTTEPGRFTGTVLGPAGQGALPKRKVLGDASEAALLTYVDSLIPIFEFAMAYPKVFEVPFNSVRRTAAGSELLHRGIEPAAGRQHTCVARNGWAVVLPAGMISLAFSRYIGHSPPLLLPSSPTTPQINKWALAITKDPEDAGSHIVMMKGAPERILDRCSQFLYNGTERPIDEDFKLDFQASYERFAFSGERVLAFAYREFKPPRGAQSDPATVYKQTVGKDAKGEPIEPYPTKDLVFAGLISLMDPPKEGTADAVAICRDAYVKVVMVTGDHPLTAEAIARRVNIVTLPTAREIAAEDGVEEADVPLGDPRVQAAIVPGYAIPALTQEQWDILLSKEEIVFARTSPQQKLQIVDNFQRLGHVVTVTGDGTNDSPALKKAQVGVSMGGATASDVAREVRCSGSAGSGACDSSAGSGGV
jgi:magnesium-transporting ATPase (P-type)